jgi:glutamine synthetase type III
MAAVVAKLEKHGNLLRMSGAGPCNDFRSGAETPPVTAASPYFGEDSTYLGPFQDGEVAT